MGFHTNTLTKRERLCSHHLIDRLFEPGQGSKSFSAFPLRVVFRLVTPEQSGNSLLISVPKRQFKHAVDRNHVKRQIREAYRTSKNLLRLPEGTTANVAFIWLDSKHYPTRVVTSRVRNLLQRITESCAKS